MKDKKSYYNPSDRSGRILETVIWPRTKLEKAVMKDEP